MAAVESDYYTVLVTQMGESSFWKNRLEELMNEWNEKFTAHLTATGYTAGVLAKDLCKIEERIKSVQNRINTIVRNNRE